MLRDRLAQEPMALALATKSDHITRAQILAAWTDAKTTFANHSIEAGDVVGLIGDYSDITIGAILALIEFGAIIVPLSPNSPEGWDGACEIVQAQFLINTLDAKTSSELSSSITRKGRVRSEHSLYQKLRQRSHAGLVLLSSGTTGRPKAVVHDFEIFLSRFAVTPRPTRTLAFMQFDHVGGIYNLFSCLFNLSPLFYNPERSPDRVGALIEQNSIEFLPTSASFLNILLVDKPWQRFDFSSLKYVVYGTERVHPIVLEGICRQLPHVKFHQNYGLSEIGLLRSTSRASDSIWLKIQDDKAQVRVRDGILQVLSPLTMLGYLNADHQTTEDGWFITGDVAEEKDGWIRVIGRETDLIKVAGQSIRPSDIEDILMTMPGVVDAIVGKEENLLIGEVITATIQLESSQDMAQARQKIREFCGERLERHKVPSKIIVTTEPVYGPRFKKKRSST